MAAGITVAHYFDLLALHRALVAARFPRHEDIYLLASPFVVNLAQRVVDAIAEAEIEQGRPDAAIRWQTIPVETNGDVWLSVIDDMLRHPDYWNALAPEDKRAELTTLFTPFIISEGQIDLLISQFEDRLV